MYSVGGGGSVGGGEVGGASSGVEVACAHPTASRATMIMAIVVKGFISLISSLLYIKYG
jgi:hypothetical protein